MYQLIAQCLFFTYTDDIYPTCFGAMCIIHRDSYKTIYLEPGNVMKPLNMVFVAVTS